MSGHTRKIYNKRETASEDPETKVGNKVKRHAERMTTRTRVTDKETIKDRARMEDGCE